MLRTRFIETLHASCTWAVHPALMVQPLVGFQHTRFSVWQEARWHVLNECMPLQRHPLEQSRVKYAQLFRQHV